MLAQVQAPLRDAAANSTRWALFAVLKTTGLPVETDAGSFNIQTPGGVVQGVSRRRRRVLQRADGYGYSWTQMAITNGDAGTGAARAAALSPLA